jgi:hypothetical protein
MAFKLWRTRKIVINKNNKYKTGIPNFNKLDITIEGDIFGKIHFPKYLHWHQKYLRSAKTSREIIPNRYSSQVNKKNEARFLYLFQPLLKNNVKVMG